MSKITIKVDKNYKLETTPKEKWLTVDLEEAIQYGSSSYSKIKIEFNSEEEIKDFVAGKKLDLKIADENTVGEGNILKIPHPWTADRTIGQKTTDKAFEVGKKAKETSKKATQTTGKSVQKTGEKMQDWPPWVLPTIIIVGVILFGGIIYWIFKRK